MKNIIMLPSWYPTADNPIPGSFFKEQAEVLNVNNNVYVALIATQECCAVLYLLRTILNKKFSLNVIHNSGITEVHCFGSYYKLSRLNRIIFKLLKYDHHDFHDSQLFSVYNYAFLFIINNLKFRPDVIYAMTAQINCVPAYTLAEKYKLPLIIAEHVPFPLPGNIITKKQRMAIENSNAVLSTSNHLTRMIIMQNIKCSPIILGNMLNEKYFYLTEHQNNKQYFMVTIIGAYNYYKDYTTFFKVMSFLRSITTKQFRIQIIGVQLSKEVSIFDEGISSFNKEFYKFNLADITTIYPCVDRDKLKYYLDLSDLFLSTSIQETFGVSCMEALACGVPVFATSRMLKKPA